MGDSSIVIGDTGVLVPPQDEKALIAGIESLVESTTQKQVSSFQQILAEVAGYQAAYIQAEQAITDAVVVEVEKRESAISRLIQVAGEYAKQAIFTLPGVIGAPEAESPLPFFAEGSYATGTPFVPRTGLYQLHQGEAVIPANQNTTHNSQAYTINYYGAQGRSRVHDDLNMRQLFNGMQAKAGISY